MLTKHPEELPARRDSGQPRLRLGSMKNSLGLGLLQSRRTSAQSQCSRARMRFSPSGRSSPS